MSLERLKVRSWYEKDEICDLCGIVNHECFCFKIPTVLFFKKKIVICQSCVSRIFRNFKKD